MDVRLRPRELDPVSGHLGRRLEQHAFPGESPEGAMGGLEAGDQPSPRHRDSGRSDRRKRLEVVLLSPKPTSIASISPPRRRRFRPRPGRGGRRSPRAVSCGRARDEMKHGSRRRRGSARKASRRACTRQTEAATHASTALPPSSRARAPAAALSGWPAATAPFIPGPRRPRGREPAAHQRGCGAGPARARPQAARCSRAQTNPGSTDSRGGAPVLPRQGAPRPRLCVSGPHPADALRLTGASTGLRSARLTCVPS